MKTTIYLFENRVESITYIGSFHKYTSGFFTKEGEEELMNGEKAFVMQSIETKDCVLISKNEVSKAILFERK